MPKYRVTSPDGKSFEVTAPDGATPDQVLSYAQSQFSAKPADTAPEVNTAPSKAKGGIGGGLFMGAIRDPLDAGAQLLPRALSTITSLGGLAPNPLSEFFDGESKRVDGIVKNANTEYQESREMAGRDGFDAARLTGNVVSPVNLAIMAKVPLAGASGVAALAGRGAAQGAISGAMQPVTGDPQDFTTQKLVQVGGGAIGGAALTPVAAKLGESVVRAAGNLKNRLMPGGVEQAADQAVRAALSQEGVDLSQVSSDLMDKLRAQASDALKSGQKLDARALVRQQDFDRLGIPPTTGQISRDPTQYTRERNLAATDAGAGLKNRFSEQSNMLMQIFDRLGAGDAVEPYVAGNKLVDALRQTDAPVQQRISQAYGLARNTDGRYANVDVPGFSKAANDRLDQEMLGHFLPPEARGLLNDISSGTIPLNVNNLVQVDSRLSALQREMQARGKDSASLAISRVRDALNAADIEPGAGPQAKQAFDQARNMAADRFQRIESTPALKAALNDAAPDDFVRKYIVNAKAGDLQNLAGILRDNPDALQTVKAQVAAYLKNQAYGANGAGDGNIGQATFNRTLGGIPTDKLRALFSDAEIEDLKSLGRVAAYINQRPAGSAVNESNTAGATLNLLANLSGKAGAFPGLNLVRDSVRTYGNERFANNALAGLLAKQPADLSPEIKNRLLTLLSPLPIGFAAAAGSPAP